MGRGRRWRKVPKEKITRGAGSECMGEGKVCVSGLDERTKVEGGRQGKLSMAIGCE